MVDHPPGGAHHKGSIFADGGNLWANSLATVNRNHGKVWIAGDFPSFSNNLKGQFASGDQHNAGNPFSLHGSPILKKWHQKRSGFACTGLGLANHVVASERQWNDFALDRCWFGVASALQRGKELRPQIQCFQTVRTSAGFLRFLGGRAGRWRHFFRLRGRLDCRICHRTRVSRYGIIHI